MTPQSQFLVVAEVADGHLSVLTHLLATMNDRPGMARPDNRLVPFGAFGTIHFARFVILADRTQGDFADYGLPPPGFRDVLAFLGDCDGSAEELLADMAHRAADGLREIFSHCEGFTPDTELLDWMRTHSQASAANYVNWVGRTVTQVREESQLRDILVACVGERQEELLRDPPSHTHAKLVAACRPRIALTPPSPTPFGWSVRNALHAAVIPAALVVPWLAAIPFLIPPPPHFMPVMTSFAVAGALLFVVLSRQLPAAVPAIAVAGFWLVPQFIFFPLLIVPVLLAAAAFLLVLRRHEKTEPESIVRPEVEHILQLSAQEDHDVTNQFSALGAVKPSRFRRGLFAALLWLVDYSARHVFHRGHLGRIRTIHFARWVFLEGKRRMFFASNYDGSHEAYMDDFINKAGWALNVAFGNAVGYPRTSWIILGGADDEMKFKHTQRRHQIPTQSWYRAYPGLTVYDLERNARVRRGFERPSLTNAEARLWLQDL